MEDIKISHHLSTRISERMGIPKKAHERLCKLFLKRGRSMEQVYEDKDLDLFRYLCYIKKEGCDLRVYGEYILISDKNTNIGLTIVRVPKLKNFKEEEEEKEYEFRKRKKIKGKICRYKKACPDYRSRYWDAKKRRKRKGTVRRKEITFDCAPRQ